MTIRVLLADDHEVVRRGLKSLFQDTEVEVVREASNGEEALRGATKTDVDLVILDVRMPGLDGLNVLGRLKLDLPDLPDPEPRPVHELLERLEKAPPPELEVPRDRPCLEIGRAHV